MKGQRIWKIKVKVVKKRKTNKRPEKIQRNQ